MHRQLDEETNTRTTPLEIIKDTVHQRIFVDPEKKIDPKDAINYKS
jgi:hypothetical protein